MRWDRLGRISMLVVLGALLYLYLSAGLSYLSSWREAKRHSAAVAALERENRQLRAQRATLNRPGTLESEARQLGMVRAGERAYIIQGLPRN